MTDHDLQTLRAFRSRLDAPPPGGLDRIADRAFADVGIVSPRRPRARRLAIPVSPDTLLRLILRTPAPPRPTPAVLGLDDWAYRKGHRYGTIPVDLAHNQVVDLLPDRQASTVST